MSSLLKSNYCMILLCIILLGIIVYRKTHKREDFNKNTPKILIIIISAKNGIERWKNEKKLWETYSEKFENIDCVFTECKENFTLEEDCIESFIPGIFQKTILTLSRKQFKKYDYYIRANLSSFYIFDYLNYIVPKYIPMDVPSYGGFCTNWIGVQGTGIVMNRKAKEILQKAASNKMYFHNTVYADDVLICRILDSYNVKRICFDFMYHWDFNKSIESNISNIKNRMTPSIRLKTDNTKLYNQVCEELLKHYYL